MTRRSPARWSSEAAWSYGRPDDVRNGHRLRSLRDVDPHLRALGRRPFRRSATARSRVPSSRSELTSTTCALSPARVSSATASSHRLADDARDRAPPACRTRRRCERRSPCPHACPRWGSVRETVPSSTSEFATRSNSGTRPASSMFFDRERLRDPDDVGNARPVSAPSSWSLDRVVEEPARDEEREDDCRSRASHGQQRPPAFRRVVLGRRWAPARSGSAALRRARARRRAPSSRPPPSRPRRAPPRATVPRSASIAARRTGSDRAGSFASARTTTRSRSAGTSGRRSGRRGGTSAEVLHRDLDRAVARERDLAGQQLVEHDPGRVEVGASDRPARRAPARARGTARCR